MFEYKATLISIYDGDTLHLDVDCGFHIHVQEKFRLARVNAPELLSFGGMAARLFVSDRLTRATAIKVVSSRSRQEKYGRWLVEVLYQTANNKDVWHNLSDELLESGNAVRYKP